MIRRAGIGAALAATLLMPGVCVSLQGPLSAPGDSEPDIRLEGVWQVTSDAPDYISYVFVVPLEHGLLDVDVVDYQYKKHPGNLSPVEWHRFRVFRTEIDGRQFLNVMPVAARYGKERIRPEGERDSEGDEPVYFIFKYDISQDGVLTIWETSFDILRRDIEEGKLAGRDGFDTTVTDSPENLREYLRQGNDPFTQHLVTLRKILSKVPGR